MACVNEQESCRFQFERPTFGRCVHIFQNGEWEMVRLSIGLPFLPFVGEDVRLAPMKIASDIVVCGTTRNSIRICVKKGSLLLILLFFKNTFYYVWYIEKVVYYCCRLVFRYCVYFFY